MGLLDSLTGGDVLSAGVSLLGGAAGAISANKAAKKQFQYQQELNKQSQMYGVTNATTAYNRQRALTHDNPLLQKTGLRDAGLSASFSDGSSVPAAANVDQSATPSPGSAPSVASLAEGFNQGSQAAASIADLAVKKSQIGNTNADTAGKDIENQFKAQQQIADLKLKIAQAKNVDERTRYQDMLNMVYARTGLASAEASKAILESTAGIKKVEAKYAEQMSEAELKSRIANYDLLLAQKDLSKEQRDNLIQERANMQKQLLVMDSQINLNNANAEDARSHVAVNRTQAEVNRTQADLNIANKTGVELDNTFKALTQGDRLQISFEECSQAKLRTFAMKLQTMPKTMSEALSRKAMESYEKIQRGYGKPIDYTRVASQICKEAAITANQEAKDWAKIAISIIPLTSSAQTSNGYGANISSMPQYQ